MANRRVAAVWAALACGLAALGGLAAASAPAGAQASTMLPEPAAGLVTAPAQAAATAAPTPGSGRWYWPVGSEDFKGWDGWLEPRGSYVHVAQDMPVAEGHPVYAIGDGKVFISRADTGGYGPGGKPGGCLIIVHTTASGEEFRALYGHVSDLRYKDGETVAAGCVVAEVNGCAHLHFSIHPSATYRDGNPYAGHVPKSWADHGGFVDPVKYLVEHPRQTVYQPPPVPVVSIDTPNPPAGMGAAAGVAYWSEQTSGGLLTYRYDLASGRRAVLAPGDTVPAFDEVRYAITPLAAPAVGFSVGDRLPVLSGATPHATPAWGVVGRVSAGLANAAAAPFVGARIRLERLSGTTWVRVAVKPTAADGRADLGYAPAERTSLRLVFVPPVAQPPLATYVGVFSATLTLTPHVALTQPMLPKSVARSRLVAVSGLLKPRHAAGSRAVRLSFERLVGGTWVAARGPWAVLSNCAAGSRYRRDLRFETAGSWRVRAWHPDDTVHADTASAWRMFTVK